MTREMLYEMTGAEVSLDEAKLTSNGRLLVVGLELRVPGIEGETGRLLEVGSVVLEPCFEELVQGNLEVSTVVINRPVV
ncbi:MAG: hypothetical protein MJA84_14895, partial [Firmicutes bacterium]|nr:hypothetical protein [Bacillota bacterium]